MQRQRVLRCIFALVPAALLAACGDGAGTDAAQVAPVLTAATLGEQNVLPNRDYFSDPRYGTADTANGEKQAQVCRACHSLEQGGPNMLGPNLYGVFGKSAAMRSDFAYSAALSEAGFSWTPRALEAWLAQPARFLPGNRMTFAGVPNDKDRSDLVAFLLNATDDAQQ